jgi:hypothetical protein
MPDLETIQFTNDHQAALLRVKRDTPGQEIVRALSLPEPRAVLCLNGGTAQLKAELKAHLQRLLQDGVARAAADGAISLLTGGTDAGIFALLGQGLARWGRTAPCVGVVPEGCAAWPGHAAGKAPLEPHHSHFVAVAGNQWGNETATMYALFDELSRGRPSVTVFAGGGEITAREMLANVRQGREMILLAGSGRKTDAVLAVQRGAATTDPTLQEVAAKGRIVPFDLQQSAEELRELIKTRLHAAP